MLVVSKKAEGEYRTSLYRNTSPSLTINGASSEIGVWKSENGRISANFTLPNEPSVSILFHSAEMKEYLQTIGVPKDMIQQLSDNTSNGKSERVNKADFEKVQKLYDTIRDSFDNGVNQMGEVVADHCLSMHHPTFGKGHTYINLKPEGVLRDVLSIGFDRNGTPTTLNYKPNANGRFEPIYNLITNDFVGEAGAKLYGTNPDFHRAMQRIIKSIDKTSAYQAASLPNPKAEEMKRAGDVVSRSFQSKSKYSALNQERTGVMQEWYKAAILMGAATELGDTALRNSAMQIMQNVVEGHTGSQNGFKNMVELMEKSETYKMEMARFQAKDLKEIFSQDCTQEMRGSKDNNTLFQDAIRNLAGRIGGAEAMTAIAAAQHFQQEQVEKELQAQQQDDSINEEHANGLRDGDVERTNLLASHLLYYLVGIRLRISVLDHQVERSRTVSIGILLFREFAAAEHVPACGGVYDDRQMNHYGMVSHLCDMPFIRILDMTPQYLFHVDFFLCRHLHWRQREEQHRHQEELFEMFHIL